MAEVDYYRVLRIRQTATSQEIRGAYRQRARECHPDLNPDSAAAEEQFKQVSEAYQILGDPESRAKYDCRWSPRVRSYSSYTPTYHREVDVNWDNYEREHPLFATGIGLLERLFGLLDDVDEALMDRRRRRIRQMRRSFLDDFFLDDF